MKRYGCVFFLFLLVPNVIFAQIQKSSTTDVVQRDTAGVSLLGRVVTALGGSAALQSTGVIARGSLQVEPAGISGPILWEVLGSEFRYERPGPDGTVIFVSGHGNPAIAHDGKIKRNIIHLADTSIPPHMTVATLAAHLSNSAIQISAVENVILNGTPALKVSTVDTSDELSVVVSKQDWYIDPSTFLPLRVEFLASEARNALDTARMTYIFSNWSNVTGVLMPFHVVTLFDGHQLCAATFDSIQIGVSIPATDFDAPSGTPGSGL